MQHLKEHNFESNYKVNKFKRILSQILSPEALSCSFTSVLLHGIHTASQSEAFHE
jgi:hypothetical protein